MMVNIKSQGNYKGDEHKKERSTLQCATPKRIYQKKTPRRLRNLGASSAEIDEAIPASSLRHSVAHF